jgi:hypothetical protein
MLALPEIVGEVSDVVIASSEATRQFPDMGAASGVASASARNDNSAGAFPPVR